MARFSTPFVADDLPAGNSGTYEALPPGWYTATINGAEIKQTKSGTGRYIAVRYDITGPTHQGRVIFSNLNIENANPKAEEIGRQQLRALMEAIGLAKLGDTDQLIGANVKIKLKIERDEQYGDRNQVSAFATNGSAPVAKPVATAPATKASSAPPWAR
jgi:hypothetical protein